MPAQEPITAAAALRAHLADCLRARGWWHGLSGALQSWHAWLRPRLVSTLLVLLALLAGALCWA
ncbi:hypothetical protein NYO99_03385 [Pelomonas sp. UHG3]|jgi:hypothetical protein|uniref:Uncharacterized protein n=1 Tax=Roseateles hydrophilus TaxID=2975054 RepID=A0ACC6C6E6_9BURK|nr:hypothetical protein [Pelomonas sp. UHG3]MCY4744008.1 hypothetical protein [Pelomonas sp. UHG3]